MRIVVIGLGVQGRKRRSVSGPDVVATVDPVIVEAEYRALEDIPLGSYDAAILCVPDEPKIRLLTYLVENGKHALVEKPLWAADDDEIVRLEALARARKVVCYTAYNHRFEPHFARMHELIATRELGRIYRCRLFYGNGTAQLVRDSTWRDQGGGVLPDLGSHLLDTVAYWFGPLGDDFRVYASNCYENRAPDHVVFGSEATDPHLELEVTLLSWRNHFTCDVFAEHGSAHVRSLCKWGPASFTKRMRIRPSGRPLEETITLMTDDPTWALEYAEFERRCKHGVRTDLSVDSWLNRLLRHLSEAAISRAVT